jgi:hypothetical protein
VNLDVFLWHEFSSFSFAEYERKGWVKAGSLPTHDEGVFILEHECYSVKDYVLKFGQKFGQKFGHAESNYARLCCRQACKTLASQFSLFERKIELPLKWHRKNLCKISPVFTGWIENDVRTPVRTSVIIHCGSGICVI